MRNKWPDDDVGADGREGEQREQGDTDPGGDQPLDRAAVVGAERDLGLEPGQVGRAREDLEGATLAHPLDPALAGQIGEPDTGLAGERMPGREADVQRVLEQRHLLEVRVQGWFQVELVDQGQLQLEGTEHGLALVRVALEQLQADARVAPAEFGHGPGHEGGPGGGEPAQPEPAGAQAGQGLQLTLGGGQAPREPPRRWRPGPGRDR